LQELKEAVRKSIVDAALHEFLAKGYGRTSMRGIASRAGITHGNIYRYFDSKGALFQSMVARSKGALLEVLAEVLVTFDPDTDLSSQLEALAQKLTRLVLDHRDNLMLLLEMGPSDEVSQLRDRVVRMISDFFRSHIGPGAPFEDEFFLDLTSSNVYRGFLEVIRRGNGREWTVTNLNLLVRYHLFGIANFAA